jgi:hypothetical protein
MLHSGNYTSYSPSLGGSGASGTWSISVTGSAGSVAWTNVSGKPSTFAPSAHTHTISEVTGLQTALDGKLGTSAKAADSNLLDGLDSSQFLRSDTSDTVSTGRQISFYSYDDIESTTGDQASLEVYQDTSGADAFMQFHVGGDFALYFGLDGSTNDLAVGGWSMGANKYRVYHAGNLSLSTLGYTGATNANYITNNNQLTNGAGYITGISFANVSSKPAFSVNSMLSSRATTAIDTVGDSNGVTFNYLSSSTSNKPSGTDHSLMTMSYSANWQTQLAQDWRNKGRMYLRGQNNGTWSSWVRVHSTDDFSTTDVANGVTAYGWGDHAGLYAAASHNHTSLNLTGSIYNGNNNYSIDLKDHSDRTWFRNQVGGWVFQSGTSGDDWTQSFTFYLPSAGSTANNVWAEFGQRDSNDAAAGRYRGLRIVKDTGSVADGDLRAGAIYIGTTRKDQNWDTAYSWGNHASAGYITGYTVTSSDVTTALGYTPYQESTALSATTGTFSGDITVNGNQVITSGSNADVKFSVWSGTTYGIGMTSGVTYGGLNDYAMTFCMNNDSDRGFWWGYSGQSKSSGAMSLTTSGHLTVEDKITTSKSEIDFTPTSDTIALDIRGTGTPNDYFTVSNATGGANDVFLPIFFYKAATYGYNGGTNRYTSGVYGGGFIAAVDDTSYPNAAGAGAAMHFNARTYANNGPLTNRYLFSWGSWLTTHMAMTAGGNLLIGKTSDNGKKLQINGNAHISGDLDVDGTITGYAPSSHAHAIADVTGLQSALDGKQAAGSYAAASHEHDRIFLTDSRGAARAPSYYNDRYAQWDFQNSSDTGAGGDTWHGLLTVAKWTIYDASHRQEQLAFTGNDLKRRTATSDSAWGSWKTILDSSNFSSWAAPSSHTHVISDITSLQSTLDGKQAAGLLDRNGLITTNDWNSFYTDDALRVVSAHNFTAGSNNAPDNSYNYGAALTYRRTSNEAFQMYFPENNGDSTNGNRRVAFRTGWNGSWSSWRRFVDMIDNVGYVTGGNDTGFEVHSDVGYNQDPGTYFLLRGQADNNQPYALKILLTGNASGNDIEWRRLKMNGSDDRMYYAPEGQDQITFEYTVVTPSDARLKDNVKNISNPIEKLSKLNGCEFDWNSGVHEGKHDVGVIAQEVEAVIPEAVGEGSDGIKSVAYDKLVPLLIESVKEQQAMIEELKQEIQNLKNK